MKCDGSAFRKKKKKHGVLSMGEMSSRLSRRKGASISLSSPGIRIYLCDVNIVDYEYNAHVHGM